MLFNNKKAGEKLLSIWWFFVLAVIGGVTVLGVYIYYSADTGVKQVEAEILVNQIIDCVSSDNTFNSAILNNSFDFYKSCNLNPLMFGIGSFYFFNVSISSSNGDLIVYNKTGGDFSLESDCRVAMKISNSKNYPGCVEAVYPLRYGNQTLRMDVLAGSNQIGGKISL